MTPLCIHLFPSFELRAQEEFPGVGRPEQKVRNSAALALGGENGGGGVIPSPPPCGGNSPPRPEYVDRVVFFLLLVNASTGGQIAVLRFLPFKLNGVGSAGTFRGLHWQRSLVCAHAVLSPERECGVLQIQGSRMKELD